MVSKGEVLESIAIYRKQLGEERVKHLGISDDWSNAMTLVVLLLKEPSNTWYQSRLDDEETREAVSQKVQLLQELA